MLYTRLVLKEVFMGSEIAHLREQLDLISASMFQFYGFAAVGKHEFITHKYELLGKVQEELARKIGEEEALQEVVNAIARNEPRENSEAKPS